MEKISPLLIGLAALGFVLAVVSVLLGISVLGVGAEAYSRACTNLALIAIGLLLWSKKENKS